MRTRAFAAVIFGVLVAGPHAMAAPACPPITEEQAVAAVDVVFDGVAQPGPAAPNGVLESPAHFSVISFAKGSGPPVIQVAGGGASGAGPLRLPDVGLEVHAGEEWVIYAKGSPDEVMVSSSCYGSHLTGGPGPFVNPAPTPSARPSPSPSESAGPGIPVSPGQNSWLLWSAGGVAGLLLVMGIGWFVARGVVGTV